MGIADAAAEAKQSAALATRLIARAFTGASLIFSAPTRLVKRRAGTCHNAVAPNMDKESPGRAGASRTYPKVI